ncbi:AMP-binding protein [Gordonia humi]|uniref:Acetyl-CoA synthetase n=1 Tax=Gordonia humi TaxID=686429 RepID=A0A840F662_9ACTN|nr:AMP-binding protein [Gordonia humi]MBB4138043.1 acetyl-CoA synthetase [Gordonia humi]
MFNTESGNAATTALHAARDLLVTLRSSYDDAVSQFSWPAVGERFNFAHDWFDAYAIGNTGPALVIVEEDGSRASYTFDEMATRSTQVAAHLRGLGVGRGDSVVVMLGNQVELWESMLAVIRLGAVVMPTTTAVGPADLVDRLERGAAKAVICNAADTNKFAELPGDYLRIAVGEAKGWERYAAAHDRPATPIEHPGNASTDRLLLYFTSGTTSRPKLVEHTHLSYPVGHLSTMYWLGLEPGDVHLNISSPGWAKHAWSNFFAPWLAEATTLVYNYARFDAGALLHQLDAEAVTTFCAPPTVWRMLINADLSAGRPRALREAIGAGEPLNPEVIHQVEKNWGLTIRDGFGQTECTATIANTPGQIVKAGSMGRPLPGVPVVLVDPTDRTLVEGVGEGEICLDLAHHPLTLMTGYQGDETRNALAMEGGYYHTGDVASRDEDGYITYVGRTDDVFKASDYKVSPFELESVLIEHPAVAEAAIVPAPDAVRLAIPKAYVSLAPGHEPGPETAREILAFARERLPPYLRIRRIEFYDLPKTISGKIRRVELRQREQHITDRRPAGEYRDEDFDLRR